MATVTVKSGDTLSKIARSQGVGISDISGFRSGDINKIFPGEVLTINTPNAPVATQQQIASSTPFQPPQTQIIRREVDARRQIDPVGTSRPRLEARIDATNKIRADISRQEKLAEERNQSANLVTPQILDLQKEIARLGGQSRTLEEQSLREQTDLEGQGRGITLASLQGQQGNIREIASREQRDVSLQRLAASDQLLALTGLRQVDLDAAQTSQDAADTLYDRLLGIEKLTAGLEEKERQEARQNINQILEFSNGLSFEDMDAESRQLLEQAATQSGIPIGIIGNALSRNKLAAEKESDTSLSVENIGGFQVLRDASGKVISSKAPSADQTVAELKRGETTIIADVKVPSFEDFIAEKEQELLQTLTPEVREEFRAEYDATIQKLTLEDREAKLESLSSLAEGLFLNPQLFFESVLTPTDKGKLIKEITEAGLPVENILKGKKQKLSATQSDDLVQAQIARQGVLKLKSLLDNLEGKGPVIGRLLGLNPFDAQRAQIEAEIIRIIPGLARGVFKEVGVLTDADVDRYQRTLANPRATDEQIQLLFQDTLEKIDTSLETIVSTYDSLGYDLKDFSIGDALSAQPQANNEEFDLLRSEFPNLSDEDITSLINE